MASLRQLLVISSVVIACILVVMLAVGMGLMERKLDAQLQTDGENVVATLALLVGSQPDQAARARVLDAAFQQGRFQELSLLGPDGTVVFQGHRQRLSGADTPRGWSTLVQVGTHRATRRVPGAGQLILVLDMDSAREALWAHIVQWFWLALGLAAFWALFVAALVARVRRELAAARSAPAAQRTD